MDETAPSPPIFQGEHGRERRDPRSGGAPWWAYQRPETGPAVTGPARGRVRPDPPEPPAPTSTPDLGSTPRSVVPTSTAEAYAAMPQTGQPHAVAIAALLAASIIATRVLGNQSIGVWLIPIAGIVAAIGFGHRCLRVHPDEPWLPRLLLLGTLVKLGGSYVRYLTVTDAYDNAGDAAAYDIAARRIVAGWLGQRESFVLPDLRQTNFMKWLTAVQYYLFGESLLAAFAMFSLVALIGSYFWYRALVDSVPFVNKRLFFIFMMFAPSIVFWPSSLGKEALMQLGVGAVAWATSLLLRGRLLSAVPLGLGGGWLLWIVRPHLLALVTLAAVIPYFLGRVSASKNSLLTRPAGMILLGILVVFTVTSSAKFLGLQSISVEAVQDELNNTTERTTQGGSSFQHGSASLSPLALPNGAVTVLFRPFIWEARSGFQLLAALEASAVIGLVVVRFDSIRIAFLRSRRWPFLLYCWILLVLYSMTFSSFGNFGLLNRQRSLVLPALYALIAIDPMLARRQDRASDDGETTAVQTS